MTQQTDDKKNPNIIKPASGLKASIIIGLMFAMFVIPYTYVLYIYNSGEIPTASTTERGVFFEPILKLSEETITKPDGSAWELSELNKQWAMLSFVDTDCEQSCLDSVFNVQQAISSLTRNKGKVEQIILHDAQHSFSEDLQTIIALKENVHPIINDSLLSKTRQQMGIEGSLSGYMAIVDPAGQLLLFYTPQQSVQDILRDIKRLLKASVSGYQ